MQGERIEMDPGGLAEQVVEHADGFVRAYYGNDPEWEGWLKDLRASCRALDRIEARRGGGTPDPCDRYREALDTVRDVLSGTHISQADVFAAYDRANEALSDGAR